MQTSIATVSISGEFPEKLAAIAAAGFDGVEIFENDFLAFDGGARDVGRMVRDHGLTITLFQPFRDFETLPEPYRSQAFGRAERKFDLMQDMGAEMMLVCSSVSPHALGGIDRAAADFRELGDRAAKRGLKVGYEALAWGRYINDHRDAWEVVRRADHPNVGLILDSFHTLGRRIDVDTIRSIPKDKIFIVQLADAPAIEMDLLYWSRHFRNMPGEGDLPVTDFMRAVAATGYDGYISLEIFNDQFRGGSPSSISVDGRRSLLWLMDQVQRTEPDIRASTATMPERVEVKGVEFVEFTTGAEELGKVTEQLARLGFRKAGRHISKEVELYRQGGINIVVNSERKGLSHSSFLAHGTSAYALGLRVEDARQAFDRACALGADPYVQPVASGETEIPAVRGVGGSLVYFVDEATDMPGVWHSEFGAFDGIAPGSSVGLTRIDHVGQTTSHGEMLTWLLFYTSIFEAQKTPLVDVIDPDGLVRSQAIENDSGSLRITLNGADNHRTLAGRFITDTFGASTQHLAFASNDIFGTAAALRELGFAPLQISPNYYDDLEARFDLDQDLMARLRSSGTLFDRDEHGEFFQLYAPTWGSGFIFEIVERRGGYQGYGASNAPFRLAAQKRLMPRF